MSLTDRLLISLDFIVDLALDHLGLDGELVTGETERFLGLGLRDVCDLEEDSAGLDYADPVIDCALALTHPDFERLLGDRLVGEDPDVDLATAAEVPAHGDTAGLDLVRPDPGGFESHKGVIAEGNVVSSLGGTLHSAPHHLAILDSLRQQHVQLSFLATRARPSRRASPAPGRRRACGRRRFFLSSSSFGRGRTAARRCLSPTISPWNTHTLMPMIP